MRHQAQQSARNQKSSSSSSSFVILLFVFLLLCLTASETQAAKLSAKATTTVTTTTRRRRQQQEQQKKKNPIESSQLQLDQEEEEEEEQLIRARRIKQDDNDKNKDEADKQEEEEEDDEDDEEDDEEEEEEEDNKDNAKNENEKDASPPPTLPPSRLPTLSPTRPPTTPPPTTRRPTSAPSATTVATEPQTTTAPTRPPLTNPPSTSSGVNLSLDELRDIQFQGDGDVTLRFSLWFQDGTAARSMTSPYEIATLHALQKLLCQTTQPQSLSDTEERELCMVRPDDLSPTTRQALGGVAVTDGSILIQPPTTYIVDRTTSSTPLYWTTWRVTFDVLRLGTFSIMQGLENAQQGAAQMEATDIYTAGVRALQQVLELALHVSIREQSFDTLLRDSMAAQDVPGFVLSSVYGEEVETFEAKLNWLGIDPNEPPATEPPQSENIMDHDNNTTMTLTNADNGTTLNNVTGVQQQQEEEEEDDDDRYSEEFGLTEPLDPPFWHVLRIVGILLFVFTLASLIGLCKMSSGRRLRREQEAKVAKEQRGKGVLNNAQGVEDMLRSSNTDATTPVSKSMSKDDEDNDKQKNKDDDEDDKVSIPMPKNLKVKK